MDAYIQSRLEKQRTKINYLEITYLQRIKNKFRKQIINVVFKNKKRDKDFH